MIIRECMKTHVTSVKTTATIIEAASVLVKNHVGLLPVLNFAGQPVGMVPLENFLSLELPDFIRLIADVDFVHDFGAVETERPSWDLLTRPITSIMRPVITVDEENGLLHTYARMLKHDLNDLLVINARSELVGIVSRVDIGTAVLSIWKKVNEVY